MSTKVSVIIPVYNEEKVLEDCLSSLQNQTYKDLEIIVVDDGSQDKSAEIAKKYCAKILKQNHRGPGTARNLGASKSQGEVLVFVDADMTFEKEFVKDLTAPILKGKTIGTFSKNEFVKNKDNIWSKNWNINKNLPLDRMIPQNYPDNAPVFRAIKKIDFERAGGFETSGQYTDDWSLSEKLNTKSSLAKGAIYYHSNPSTISEVFKQARWIGKNKFISGNFLRISRSLLLYCLPASFLIGLYKAAAKRQPSFIIFKLVYDFALWRSVLGAFFGEKKSK